MANLREDPNHGLCESRMVTGNTPAKWQVKRPTCRGAAAMDGRVGGAFGEGNGMCAQKG